jgi:hypothetical protein
MLWGITMLCDVISAAAAFMVRVLHSRMLLGITMMLCQLEAQDQDTSGAPITYLSALFSYHYHTQTHHLNCPGNCVIPLKAQAAASLLSLRHYVDASIGMPTTHHVYMGEKACARFLP